MASRAAQITMEQPVTQKPSRYRSVRQNSNNGPALAPPPLPPLLPQPASSPPKANVSRSMSRYHRQTPAKFEATPPIPEVSSSQINPSHAASLAALTGASQVPVRNPPHAEITGPSAHRSRPSQGGVSHGPSQATGASSRRAKPVVVPFPDSQQEARDILKSEQERMQRLKAQQDALRRIRREEAEAKQTELAKIEEQSRAKPTRPKEATQSNTDGHTPVQNRPKRSFTIGRSADKPQPVSATGLMPVASQGEVPVLPESQNEGMVRSTFKTLRHKVTASNASSQKRKLVIGAPMPIEPEQYRQSPSLTKSTTLSPPGPPAAELWKPQTFDAPISAVNAGERRVLVRCNNSSMALPFTPTTRAQDLLNSASVVMSETIDPRSAVLVESYTQLGLERPVRRYEHVRDILNSWDNDDQNVFIINPHSDRPEGLLELKAIPASCPKSTSFPMYHSQRPGKWNKRFVNLKADGQMTVSKKEGDSDATNICHLSDFDIYGPTESQLKKIKSPKKICLAIKSQQRSTVFLDIAATNFVHFISTSDWELADRFYLAIQSWRSWYLVNMLGEGQKIQTKPTNAIEAMRRPSTGDSHQSIPYQLGSFQPLLDFDLGQLSFDLDLNDDVPPSSQTFHRRNMPSRDRRAPPSSFPSHQIDLAADGGFLKTSSDQSTSLTRVTSLRRGNSTRQKPQPLIDLTPKFREAPQHLRIGRGVKASEGQHLIDLATDIPQEPGVILVPPANDWRRPDNRSPVHRVENEDQPFTGKGLLGRSFSQRAQGASRTGHGVKGVDGKPLVDLNLNSQFVDGSLLRQVEAWKGDDERGLVVDREKRVEMTTKVGEGY